MSSNVEDYITHNLGKFNEIPEKKPVHDEIGRRRERENTWEHLSSNQPLDFMKI